MSNNENEKNTRCNKTITIDERNYYSDSTSEEYIYLKEDLLSSYNYSFTFNDKRQGTFDDTFDDRRQGTFDDRRQGTFDDRRQGIDKTNKK